MTDQQQPATLHQQAEFLDYIVSRCVMLDGKIADEAVITLTASETNELHQMAMRMHRMAPHEREIRYVVTGR